MLQKVVTTAYSSAACQKPGYLVGPVQHSAFLVLIHWLITISGFTAYTVLLLQGLFTCRRAGRAAARIA